MAGHTEPLFQWLSQYAYEPNLVYAAILGIMIASGFGLPVPEEVTIVSVGLLTYMGGHPEIFPPPFPGARVVNGYEAAVVTLVAVVFSDFLIFTLGRVFGRRIMMMPRLQGFFSEERLGRINRWVHKYGVYAVFIFRFTPGIRFPAHVILGMSKIKAWQFMLVDGAAAMISVPTQIVMIYHFGEPILHIIHKFKIWIGCTLAVVVLILLIKNFLWPRLTRRRRSLDSGHSQSVDSSP